jgi:signal transduction histidine kinase
VSDLLDLTRIEAGKIELAPEALDVTELVTDAAESLRPVAKSRDIQFDLDLDGGGVCARLWGDPDKVHQVLANLLSNAVKFSPRGGRVTVTARPEPPSMVRLAVRDTGQGVPAGDRDRVFDKFYQVGRVDGERPDGSGLGLTIARHLVELHGGRIWVEAGWEPGSTFVVLLPMVPAPVGEAAR